MEGTTFVKFFLPFRVNRKAIEGVVDLMFLLLDVFSKIVVHEIIVGPVLYVHVGAPTIDNFFRSLSALGNW